MSAALAAAPKSNPNALHLAGPASLRRDSPLVLDAARAAVAAAQAAHPELSGEFRVGVLALALREIWVRYTVGNDRGKSARQWLFRPSASPELVELV